MKIYGIGYRKGKIFTAAVKDNKKEETKSGPKVMCSGATSKTRPQQEK